MKVFLVLEPVPEDSMQVAADYCEIHIGFPALA
jgi:hypothetical protein